MSNMFTLKPDDDIKQRELVAYEEYYNATPEDLRGRATINQALVVSALKANWFANGATVEALDELSGLDVQEMAQQVDATYDRLMGLDKKK